MSDHLTTMWERLADFQPLANGLGFGAEWRTMCEQQDPAVGWKAADRTADSTHLAAVAASRAAAYAADAASRAVGTCVHEDAAAFARAAIHWIVRATEEMQK